MSENTQPKKKSKEILKPYSLTVRLLMKLAQMSEAIIQIQLLIGVYQVIIGFIYENDFLIYSNIILLFTSVIFFLKLSAYRKAVGEKIIKATIKALGVKND